MRSWPQEYPDSAPPLHSPHSLQKVQGHPFGRLSFPLPGAILVLWTTDESLWANRRQEARAAKQTLSPSTGSLHTWRGRSTSSADGLGSESQTTPLPRLPVWELPRRPQRPAPLPARRRTLGKDVPLHDPDGCVATTGAIGPQIHETPLEAGRPRVQDGPALLKELFRVNGLQVFRVGGHQILWVLGGGAAVQGLGESAVEPARAASHGTRCGEGKHSHSPGSSPEDKALTVHGSRGLASSL